MRHFCYHGEPDPAKAKYRRTYRADLYDMMGRSLQVPWISADPFTSVATGDELDVPPHKRKFDAVARLCMHIS
jgi:hypothetical protein